MMESVKLVTRAWREAGKRAPVASPETSGSLCCVSECSAMPFVELKVLAGRRAVCFKHFQSIKALAA